MAQLAPATPQLEPASPPIEQVTSTAIRPKPTPVQAQPSPPPPSNDDDNPTFTEQGVKQSYQEAVKKNAAIDAQTGGMLPPKLDLPKQPEVQQTSPAEAWGSSAMALSVIASALTRQPLATAFNSMGAALKAFKENDMQNAQLAFNQWKASTDMAVKMAQFQNEAYKTAKQTAEKDKALSWAQQKAYAAAYKDEAMLKIAADRDEVARDHLNLDRQRFTEKVETDAGKLLEAGNLQLALHDPAFLASLKGKSPMEVAKMKTELMTQVAPDMAKTAGVMDEPTKQMLVDWIETGDIADARTFISGFGQASGRVRMQIAQALQQDMAKKGMTPADLAAGAAELMGIKAGERTLGTQTARIGLGQTEVQTLIPLASQASETLKRTNYPTFNAAMQAYQRGVGDPKLRDLVVKIQAVRNAMSQVIARGGTGTDQVRDAAKEMMDARDPDAVLQQAFKAAIQETNAVKRAPGMVREELREGLTGRQGPPQPPGAGNQPGAGGNQQTAPPMPANYDPPGVFTQAQFDKLPHKTWFLEADGNIYYKP